MRYEINFICQFSLSTEKIYAIFRIGWIALII